MFNQIADYGNFILELQRDQNGGRIERTEAGIRTADSDSALVGLPTQGERMVIREIEQTPQEVVLRLGNRQSVGEVINDLQSRIPSVSKRV